MFTVRPWSIVSRHKQLPTIVESDERESRWFEHACFGKREKTPNPVLTVQPSSRDSSPTEPAPHHLSKQAQ